MTLLIWKQNKYLNQFLDKEIYILNWKNMINTKFPYFLSTNKKTK